MTGPTPYLQFPGTAREALTFYGDVFGGAVQLHTFAEFSRADDPADAIARGYLTGGPVALFGADVSGRAAIPIPRHDAGPARYGRSPNSARLVSRLREGGRVVDDLQTRPWGVSDGQVIDRYGLHWLIGFEGDENG